MLSQSQSGEQRMSVLALWGIHFQVADVSQTVDFYVCQPGFKIDHLNLCKGVRSIVYE